MTKYCINALMIEKNILFFAGESPFGTPVNRELFNNMGAGFEKKRYFIVKK